MSEKITLLQEAMRRLDDVPPQTRLEVMRGTHVRRKKNGLTVMTLHYSAVPDRDPETEAGRKWYEREHRKYSSEARWKKEQEIDPHATGGEAVFGRILSDFYQVVVISDPYWTPDPRWDVVGGFDHGIANATALLKGYVPRERIDPISGKPLPVDVYLAGEYYSYRRDSWDNNVDQNVVEMKKMPDMDRARWIAADPSIFFNSKEQEKGAPTNTYATYKKNNMFKMTGYDGIRSDVSFVQWMLSDYWRGIANGRKPRLYIVCRNPSDRPQPGLHEYDCPNLLWELKRAKRVEMTARQLQTKSQNENLQDKNNHLRDCMAVGTLVTTGDGYVPIERVQVGQTVLTRKGWRRVEDAWMVSPASEVMRVRFSNGAEITGTAKHLIYTQGDGWVSLDALKLGAEVVCSKVSTDQPKQGCGWESGSIGILKRRATLTANTSRRGASTSMFSSGYSRTRSRSQMATTSTIRMRTAGTTNQTTSKLSRRSTTLPTTIALQGRTRGKQRSLASTLTDIRRPTGIAVQKDKHGTAVPLAGRYTRSAIRPVRNVERPFRTKTQRRAIPSVTRTVAKHGGFRTLSARKSGSAFSAVKHFGHIRACRPDSAQRLARASVVEILRLEGLEPVYDLTVEGEPEFFANGILVHNCMKHITGRLRLSTEIPIEEELAEKLQGLDPTTQSIRARFLMSELARTGKLGPDGRPKRGTLPKPIDMRRAPGALSGRYRRG